MLLDWRCSTVAKRLVPPSLKHWHRRKHCPMALEGYFFSVQDGGLRCSARLLPGSLDMAVQRVKVYLFVEGALVAVGLGVASDGTIAR